jgi:hypothetical protein
VLLAWLSVIEFHFLFLILFGSPFRVKSIQSFSSIFSQGYERSEF